MEHQHDPWKHRDEPSRFGPGAVSPARQLTLEGSIETAERSADEVADARPHREDPAAHQAPEERPLAKLVVPAMLFASSMVMALAWLGHLRFQHISLGIAIFAAWLLVLPEYLINIGALRLGYGTYTGGQMAAFRLSAGVVCVALVSRFVLGEPFTALKILGFAVMLVAMMLISPRDRGAS